MARREDPRNTDDPLKVRLDKWLWAARFFKTRSLAKEAIDGGRVHYNGQRSKPGRLVECGSTVWMRLGWNEKTVEVLGLSDRRRGAPEAALLYRETDESTEKRERLAQARRQMQTAVLPPARRPSKKQRRQLNALKQSHPDSGPD